MPEPPSPNVRVRRVGAGDLLVYLLALADRTHLKVKPHVVLLDAGAVSQDLFVLPSRFHSGHVPLDRVATPSP